MKKKIFVSALLVLILVMSFSVTAFAARNHYKVTGNGVALRSYYDTAAHVYYRLYSGESVTTGRPPATHYQDGYTWYYVYSVTHNKYGHMVKNYLSYQGIW